MRETLDFIQKDISSRKKIRSVIVAIALFIVALIPSILLTSYSFYVNSNTGLVIGGTVSTSQKDADIVLNVYMQDRDSNGNPVAESYSKIYFIPINEYSYNSSRSSCSNGVNIDGFENGRFTLTASQKGYCDVYFDALDSDIIKSSPNGIIRLFAEQTAGEGDYKEVGQVPGDNYIINEAKTAQTCSNVTLEGRNISITASGDINCLIYLDIVTPKYWNANFVIEVFAKGATPDETYSSVSELRAGYGEDNFAINPVYIKTTGEKHEACLYFNKELCLGTDYWDTDVTTKDKLKADMEKASGTTVSCSSASDSATCNISGSGCTVYSDGVVACYSYRASCSLLSDGRAYCHS